MKEADYRGEEKIWDSSSPQLQNIFTILLSKNNIILSYKLSFNLQIFKLNVLFNYLLNHLRMVKNCISNKNTYLFGKRIIENKYFYIFPAPTLQYLSESSSDQTTKHGVHKLINPVLQSKLVRSYWHIDHRTFWTCLLYTSRCV